MEKTSKVNRHLLFFTRDHNGTKLRENFYTCEKAPFLTSKILNEQKFEIKTYRNKILQSLMCSDGQIQL